MYPPQISLSVGMFIFFRPNYFIFYICGSHGMFVLWNESCVVCQMITPKGAFESHSPEVKFLFFFFFLLFRNNIPDKYHEKPKEKKCRSNQMGGCVER